MSGNPNQAREVTAEGIVHFDASLARREKLRQKSQGSPASPSPQSSSEGNGKASPSHPVAAWKSRVASQVPSTLSTPATTIHPVAVPVAIPPVALQTPTIPTPPIPTPAIPTPAIPAPAAIQPPADNNALQRFMVQFVVEQTGYPEDIVELDADLEADLGIDSIKKAQMFGEINEYFSLDLTKLQGVSLDDFTTLRSIAQFLSPHVAGSSAAPQITAPQITVQPIAAPPIAAPPVTAQPITPSVDRGSAETLQRFMIQFVVEQTGYPEDIVELDADLEGDLGIDSIKKAQMFGEINEYFALDLSQLQGVSLDDFTTLRSIANFLTPHVAGSSSHGMSATVTETQPKPAASAAPAHVSSPDVSASRTGSGPDVESLQRFLVQFVVEQTGYPEDIVELDADLEADLGIDSIKKAQMFGELNEYFDLQLSTNQNLSLDDFTSLRHVLEFVAPHAV